MMTHPRSRILLTILSLLLMPSSSDLLQGAEPVASEAQVRFFEQEIRPLLAAKCQKCHGSEKTQGGLKLTSREDLLRGGDRGEAVTPGKPAESLLIQAIQYKEGDLRMPPEGKLKPDEIAKLTRWVESGAAWGAVSPAPKPVAPGVKPDYFATAKKHWAFAPLPVSVPVPMTQERAALRGDVDAFIQAALEEKQLRMSPEASAQVLVRRVYFDLLGLPPSPEEVAAFVQDRSSDAYEQLLDRVLGSPHFGERWGRHWLDGAGYVDVYGGDNDAAIIKFSENRWLYRDYVVKAFNEDKSYDRFLVEQLAGDELVPWKQAEAFDPATKELLIATGFLRMSADDTNENELNTMDIRYGVLHRTIETTCNHLLGLTLQCAKCHDHKYEPLTQKDYYQFQAIFQPALNPDHWLQPGPRQLAEIPPAVKQRYEQSNTRIDEQVTRFRSQSDALCKPYEEKLQQEKLKNIPEQVRADTLAAVNTPADKRTEVQKYLAEKLGGQLKVNPQEVIAALSSADRQRRDDLSNLLKILEGQKKSWQHWQVVYDVSEPTPTRMLKRGNPFSPGEEVAPAIFTVFRPANATAPISPGNLSGSGRRLALARELTDLKTTVGALAIRVRVNQIWQHLFGQGLVHPEDNFGLTGLPPTHPALLEWLSADFVARGQRLKPFLKGIMLSTVYRQSSVQPAGPAQAVDPDNKLLSRHRLRRLESESIRDAVLAVAGMLDRSVGGAPIPVDPQADGTFLVKEKGLPAGTSPWRRSLYLLSRRNYHPTMLSVFDQPNLTTNCECRNTSAVVLQSLTMLNDSLIFEASDRIAERILKVSGEGDPDRAIRVAYELILGRVPRDSESAACRSFLGEKMTRNTLAELCHTLLNTSEFLYLP
ncbi:MAG: PSD1 and planctomycete cytochrome C domain-containing protein [Planctomycetales bacterium]